MKTHSIIFAADKQIANRLILLAIVLLSTLNLKAQNPNDLTFSIYDAGVVCSDSSYTYIPGDLTTEAGDGDIILDGKIVLLGDLVNNSDNTFFNDIELIPNGNLFMANITHKQVISGTKPTMLENLTLIGSDKDLGISDCELKGILSVDSRFNLNGYNFIIDNTDPGSINYVSGHIHSESPPPMYGTIQWNIKNAVNPYSIPFGSGANNSNDLNLLYTVKLPGDAQGSVKFATYPTDDYSNSPYPIGVVSMEPHNPINVVDRFWFIEPSYGTRPEIELGFKYTNQDVDNPNKIKQSGLKAIRYNPNQLSWIDWTPPSGNNEGQKFVTTGQIPKQNFYSNWTLVSEETIGDIWLPSAFTPDRDETFTNETFGPIITFAYEKYEFYIYDRWGEQVFKSDNITHRWDGTYGSNVVQPGTFAWLMILQKSSGKKYKFTGTVSVIL